MRPPNVARALVPAVSTLVWTRLRKPIQPRVHTSVDTAGTSARATLRKICVFFVFTLFHGIALGDFAAGVSAWSRGDYKAALHEWKSLAEKGDLAAQVRLAGLYSSGQGVPRDLKEAAKWYSLAARQGDVEAERYLGFAYEKGQGVPQDYAAAAKWYRLAAEKGDLQAQRYLGFAYRAGQGVPKDFFESAKWYLKAESQKWNK